MPVYDTDLRQDSQGRYFRSLGRKLDRSGKTKPHLFRLGRDEGEARKERQRAGIEAAKAKGVYIGRQPGTTKAKPKRAIQLRDQGLTAKEIAQALGVSERTVFRYLDSA
ncbi:MAG: helix-turn-helix domain-containing protein [Planctomycetaceae bacterium]